MRTFQHRRPAAGVPPNFRGLGAPLRPPASFFPARVGRPFFSRRSSSLRPARGILTPGARRVIKRFISVFCKICGGAARGWRGTPMVAASVTVRKWVTTGRGWSRGLAKKIPGRRCYRGRSRPCAPSGRGFRSGSDDYSLTMVKSGLAVISRDREKICDRPGRGVSGQGGISEQRKRGFKDSAPAPSVRVDGADAGSQLSAILFAMQASRDARRIEEARMREGPSFICSSRS